MEMSNYAVIRTTPETGSKAVKSFEKKQQAQDFIAKLYADIGEAFQEDKEMEVKAKAGILEFSVKLFGKVIVSYKLVKIPN